MGVEAHLDFVFLSVLIDARRVADTGTGSGDAIHSQGLGNQEKVVDLLIRVFIAKTAVVGVDPDARIIELLADVLEMARRGFQPPLRQAAPCEAPRHRMSCPEFALANPDLADVAMCRREVCRAGLRAKRASLHPNTYPPKNRIDLGEPQTSQGGSVHPHIPPKGFSQRHVVKWKP